MQIDLYLLLAEDRIPNPRGLREERIVAYQKNFEFERRVLQV